MAKEMHKKYKEMVLHVARVNAAAQLFGTVKLNKILFYCDVEAFQQLGASISGATYIKRQMGPVPEGIDEIIQELEDDGSAKVIDRDMPNGAVQRRLCAQRDSDTSFFTKDELEIMKSVMRDFHDMSANDASEFSHQCPGWDVARMTEKIPLSTSLVPERPLPLTEEDQRFIGSFLGSAA